LRAGAEVALADDEELIAGRRPVEEAFVARRPAVRLLVTPNRRQALERIVLHATSLRIPIVEVEGGTLTSVAGFDGHQGVALVVRPRTWATLDDVLARAATRGEPPFVLALDSLEDPQNVGTLLRSAEAVGAHGVIFPTHRQAPLSPAAVKASAGATEHLLLVPVDDLPGALADLHVRGLRIAGADEDAPLTASQADLRGPIALVVGSEGQGIGPAVRRRTDLLVRIPMRGAIGSLNAAVAGSILLFEILDQRGGVEAQPAAPTSAGPTTAPEPTPAEPSIEAPFVEPAAQKPARKARASTARPAVAAAEPAAEKPARRRSTAKLAAAAPASVPEKPARKGSTAAKAAAPAPAEKPTRKRRTNASAAPGDDLLPGAPGPASPDPERA
jgi:23S rRNA (guanosine2251-2'-O)-methyltransferase